MSGTIKKDNTKIYIGVGVGLLVLVIVGFLIYWFGFRESAKVSISPQNANVKKGQTQIFTATVTGTTNTNNAWSVDNTSLGSIDQKGKFTANAESGTVTITVTNSGVKATATVTLEKPSTQTNTVKITQRDMTVADKQTIKFTAETNGKLNKDVKWTIDDKSLGSIDQSGNFTAKAGSGTVKITATSTKNTAEKDTITITLVPVGTPTSNPSPDSCVGGEFKRCEKLGPTTSRDTYKPFEMMCANGEYIESLSTWYAQGMHGIEVKCTGSTEKKFAGGKDDNSADKIGWKNDKPPEGGYQRIHTWYGDKWDSVGKMEIYDKSGTKYEYANATDKPDHDFDCDENGTITGIYGTTNDTMINTLGIRCGYKK